MPRRTSRPSAVRPARALGYARVSSEEQALGSSLADQQRAIRAHAESRGLEVAALYVEAASAVSERFERRVEMQRLMREAQPGDLVICDKMDRWSRDPEFSYRSVRELLQRGCALYFVADRIDPATPEGDSAMSFRILFAREEHKRIKERLVGTRKLLRDRGYYVEGLPPYGYRRGSSRGVRDPEKNVLRPEPSEAEVVRRVYALAGTGHSLSRIAAATGLKKDRIGDVLRSRVYLGEVESTEGVWIPGRHEAIVDAAAWVRARDGIAARKLGGARPRSDPGAETDGWVLRDVAACALCGARMGAAYAGPHDARRYYYRCTHRCTTRYVRVEPVEEAFAPMVIARLGELREALARPPAGAATTVDAGTIEAQRAKLGTKRARYLEMYAEGLMGHEAMREGVARVDAELMRLAAAPAPSPLADPAARRAALRDLEVIARAWERASGAQRREIARRLAVRVMVAAGAAPVPEWRTDEDLAR